jgi:chaperonin GroEL
VLIRAAEKLTDKALAHLEGDARTGANIMKRAMEEPVRLIAYNSGQPADVIVDTAKKSKADWGFDADANEWGHMLERGIVDPAKVTRAALENAASVAAMVLTTESVVTDVPEKNSPMMPPMGDMHDHM